jgi:hypothetical protein
MGQRRLCVSQKRTPGFRAGVIRYPRLQPFIDHLPDNAVGDPLIEESAQVCMVDGAAEGGGTRSRAKANVSALETALHIERTRVLDLPSLLGMKSVN